MRYTVIWPKVKGHPPARSRFATWDEVVTDVTAGGVLTWALGKRVGFLNEWLTSRGCEVILEPNSGLHRVLEKPRGR